ncbi:AMP-binding enzyme family protein [Mycolicibacterium hassiacum DSM 44199]|uniref:AMP-binding enzyme family protein n=1 Tax=Mycolicibacterium hassiacum (strain DSM 44199 / CIP 105218 / JCM 12690 / 3849) TaxID=1122247 RepID=K5B765_MYCHD|nr:AMP-binding protein [Mycolicibacterium hassiacum]EKF21408.1 AMP-binding enzyme family protein [Mycolicibacterium hassiacum DSM 44199]MDA4087135.1 acyl-CoA synthetase [Mycolicibacterium hassiacum DSM 44199]VCT91430.1 Long-chain-fatty-acid--CoA ligase [Mycolicibacterium hassiacum DSM 44199]
MLRVGDISTNNARRYPHKRALVDAGRVHTWSQVDERARRLANFVRSRGLMPGDRVMVIARNCIEWPEIAFGLAKAGLITVPVNIRLAPDEVAHIRDDSGARAAIIHADHMAKFLGELTDMSLVLGIGARRELGDNALVTDYETALAGVWSSAPDVGVSPDDLAFILYTSGTTGRAKGVMHTHRGLMYQAADTNLVTEANRSDVMLATTPFFTAGGMVRTVSWLYLGQTMVIHQKFDPEAVIDEIERSGITFTTFIPTMLQRTLAILEDGPPRDMSSLRRISYGSAPVPPGLARRAMDLLGCDLQQRYGLTECGGQATILTPQDHRDILAGRTSIATSCGQETPMCHIRVIDEHGENVPAGTVGEIVISSPANAVGYWNRPEQTAETFRPDGLRTGDLGYLDEDNYLHITGRKTDMIISGGFNVYPAEIERVIAHHRDVDLVAVVSVPDPEWGETPVAVVIPKSHVTDRETLTAELTALCRSELAGYKQPRRFEYREEFPLGPAGKILKREIAEDLRRLASQA